MTLAAWIAGWFGTLCLLGGVRCARWAAEDRDDSGVPAFLAVALAACGLAWGVGAVMAALAAP